MCCIHHDIFLLVIYRNIAPLPKRYLFSRINRDVIVEREHGLRLFLQKYVTYRFGCYKVADNTEFNHFMESFSYLYILIQLAESGILAIVFEAIVP